MLDGVDSAGTRRERCSVINGNQRRTEFASRVAIVTGASSGLGAAIARTFVQAGAHVVLAARSAEKLLRLADEFNALAESSGTAYPCPTDVTEQSSVERLVAMCADRLGGVDLLINNAGIETYYPFHRLDAGSIRRTIDVNLTATVQLSRLVVPLMLARGAGHIVNVSSTAGKHGPAFGAVYGATKAGLIAFTESLRMEYRPLGVSASVVCPGFVDGDGMYARMRAEAGRGVPLLMGTARTQAVTRAVLRAIRRDLPEVIVNRPPLRPLTVIAEAFPRLGEWVISRTIRRFLMRLADARARQHDEQCSPAEPNLPDRQRPAA